MHDNPTRTLSRLTGCAIAIVLTLGMLSGCASYSRANSYCQLYHPVYISDDDTQDTKEQVMGNNAVWLQLCK